MFLSESLKVYKLSENAKTPIKGSAESAGFDLFAAQNLCVPAWGIGLVSTDLRDKENNKLYWSWNN